MTTTDDTTINTATDLKPLKLEDLINGDQWFDLEATADDPDITAYFEAALAGRDLDKVREAVELKLFETAPIRLDMVRGRTNSHRISARKNRNDINGPHHGEDPGLRRMSADAAGHVIGSPGADTVAGRVSNAIQQARPRWPALMSCSVLDHAQYAVSKLESGAY